MIEQFRFPACEKGDAWLLEVVAGIMEEGESPAESIKREIVEDIGYEAGRIEAIASFFPSPGGSSEKIHVFLAEVTDANRISDGGGLEGENEDIRVVSMPVGEALDKLAAGEIQDDHSAAALTKPPMSAKVRGSFIAS